MYLISVLTGPECDLKSLGKISINMRQFYDTILKGETEKIKIIYIVNYLLFQDWCPGCKILHYAKKVFKMSSLNILETGSDDGFIAMCASTYCR